MFLALEKYRKGPIAELWNRPELSARDRSVVTVAALVARSQAGELSRQLEQALDNGVKPSEIVELITHLSFYSGWGNGTTAVVLVEEVFTRRGVEAPLPSTELLSLDEAAESAQAAHVEAQFGATAPGVVKYTTEVLFRHLWLRPDLAPRDRSLVTVSALIASAQVAQIPYHLGRAMDNGLTQVEAAEVLTQLAFYAGWPNVFSALPVVKEVFEKRAK